MSDNYTYLMENGPSTHHDLPKGSSGTTRKERQRGVSKFRITTGHGNQKNGVGHNQTPIYYIDGEHSPEAVLRAWKAANPSSVENLGARSLHQKIVTNKTGFGEASKAVFGPFESYAHGNHGDSTTDMDCPFCGAEIRQFPVHVDDCPEL